MSALTALNHLISSSSLGAHSSSGLFVVTILNVCLLCFPSWSSESPAGTSGGDTGDEVAPTVFR